MELVNRVAQSGIVTIDLEQLIDDHQIVELDISQFLFKGLLLREKEFRTALRTYDWEQFRDKTVAVFCSTDAIVAQWAYMLISNHLMNIAKDFYWGTKDIVWQEILIQTIRQLDQEEYHDKRIIIKGCGKRPLPDAAYLEITKRLLPIVKTLMFGEACSTVPVYKKR
ncbi:MAG TPA: DUF2480 family protein [Chitinophagales bacterium]|nr:DUF2480 family protein [Chitinophagales bacterium]